VKLPLTAPVPVTGAIRAVFKALDTIVKELPDVLNVPLLNVSVSPSK
jgi:hypothetical protein